MPKFKIIGVAIAALSLILWLTGATQFHGHNNEVVILAMGQSNMVGRDDRMVDDSARYHNPQIWEVANLRWRNWDLNETPPQHAPVPLAGGSGANVGDGSPAYYCAREIHRKRGHETKVIFNAEGSAGIDKWVEGPVGGPYTFTGPMAVHLLQQLADIGDTIDRVDGIFWLGGESNAAGSISPMSVPDFAARLAFLVQQLRAQPKISEHCPFVAGTLRPARDTHNVTLGDLEGLHEAGGQNIPFAWTIETGHMPDTGDGVHLNRTSLVRAGHKASRRFGY